MFECLIQKGWSRIHIFSHISGETESLFKKNLLLFNLGIWKAAQQSKAATVWSNTTGFAVIIK